MTRTVAGVSELLREAAWGRNTWDEVCRLLTGVLPGSAAAIVNYDLSRDAANTMFWDGIDPTFIASYCDYYVAINPWVDFWSERPVGQVDISERDSPSSAFSNSEFYVDWLARQENMTAAVGVRLEAGPYNTIHLAWHYGVERASAYDAYAAAVLEGMSPGLVEAVRAAALLRDGLEGGLRLGPLIERIDGAALLLDRERRIREANAEAAAALARADVLSGVGNVFALRDPAAQRWLEETVARLLAGERDVSGTTTFAVADRVFRVVVTRAPENTEAGFALLVPPRPQVLVVVRLLVGGPLSLDEAGLRLAFGLSAAEIRLCGILANGRSITEAADMLGISEGTVRQRVKMIFHKTRTHRQGELVALIARFTKGG